MLQCRRPHVQIHSNTVRHNTTVELLPVARTLIKAGIPVGTLVGNPAFARKLLDEGFTFVACGVDTSILTNGVDALLKTMMA